MNPAPLTRRELRERERMHAATAAADPHNEPFIGLFDNIGMSGSSVRAEVATFSDVSAEPMTLAADQLYDPPATAMAADALTTDALTTERVDFGAPAVPVALVAPAVTAIPAPTLPSRRSLRLAAQKAAAEIVPAETVLAEIVPAETVLAETVLAETVLGETVPAEIVPAKTVPSEPMAGETIIVATETVAADTPAAGIPSLRSGFVEKNLPLLDLPQPVVATPGEAFESDQDEDAPASRRAARSARTETAVRRSGNARPVLARVAPRPPAGPARRPTKSRTRRILAKGFPLVAMTFVAGLMIATSTPAAALLSQADVSARSSIQVTASGGSAKEGSQSYTAASGDTLAVARDGYESSSVEKIAQESGIRMEATYTNDPNGAIQWPFPVGVHIGDQFGYRDCAGCSSNHGGQDFNPGDGAPIQSIADGVVRVAENGGGSLGVHMIIDHEIDGRLVSSVYAHMQYDTMKFDVGDTVKVGEEIGITGTTGMSTGPHLHFEIRLDGVSKVDPLQWLYSNAG